MMGSKTELMNIITESGFALDDVILFLDTHPHDEEALCYYNDYKNIMKVAVDEYTKEYGPLSAYNVDAKNYWEWIEKPWPWEGECK